MFTLFAAVFDSFTRRVYGLRWRAPPLLTLACRHDADKQVPHILMFTMPARCRSVPLRA